MQQMFGQKVVNDFIEKQDENLIEQRWQKYKNFLAKKEKISTWIETDYQDGFLEDIFENCLGYVSKTRSTSEHYTLEREKKNETNGQKAEKMLELNKNLQETKQNFINELGLEKLTKKLQNFEELSFDEFITEYTKALKLKFADKLAERNFKQKWQAIFENDKTLACGFKTEIEKTDKEIDKMVYELYGLSDEEIKIVQP